MEQKGDRKKYPVSASDYELLEEVGQGVSAIVHRATCIPLKETVAIKVLDLEKCNSNLDEIRREAQTMSLIDHPNVLRAHCSFVVEQSLWVVMPYMAGGSCLHIMKSAFPDGFDETVIATILRECLKALEYLHGHGHIHRDVKAGNILVDANGVVKLGDFGVSACMFDTGDRQRSRNTFVGTPCWMAPEVMEQLHGYDFKADIWSFGITALELAHGHAPFSKYPPMKVLLMTLQNAPPGLDYERDKRFSKSFKEMIAMCLVKDPAKRPTAEKLLRHSFFKRARTHDYIARVVLDGLPPLGQRLRELKMKDADMLAQKKMPFGEKEERSQVEYKRGVSGWNFDIEDLKAQASLNQDDYEPQVGKDDMEQSKRTCSPGDSDNSLLEIVCHLQPPLSQHFNKMRTDDYHLPVTIHSLRAESRTDAGEHVTRIRSGPLPAPVQLSAGGFVKYISDSIVDDMDGNVPLCNDDTSSPQQPGLAYVKENRRKECQLMGKPDERDWRIEKVHREGRRASSGPLVPEYVLASYRCREDERDRDRQSTSSLQRDRTHSGPLTSYGASPDYRFTNGIPGPSKPSSGTKEGSEKGLYVQKKGRFSVTSEDVDLVEGPSRITRKSASLQAFPQLSLNSHPSPPASSGTMSVSAATILPHLQNILQQTISQQEIISNLIDSISQCEAPNAQCLSHLGSKHLSRNSSIGNRDPPVDVSSERERELLQHVAELQSRLASLVDELQAIKLRNVSLERQLNAIYNKEEEERIRREEAAKENN